MFSPPDIALSEEGINVVWSQIDTVSRTTVVLLAKSTDGGNTFSEPIKVGNKSISQGSPTIAASKNAVYVVWLEGTEYKLGTSNISLAKSTDGGNTFSEPIKVGNKSISQGSPTIAASKNAVYVVWLEGTEYKLGTSNISLAKSTDGGNTFSEPVHVTNVTNDSMWPFSHTPSLAISEDNTLVVAWRDVGYVSQPEPYIVKSADGGNTFSEPVQMSSIHFASGYC